MLVLCKKILDTNKDEVANINLDEFAFSKEEKQEIQNYLNKLDTKLDEFIAYAQVKVNEEMYLDRQQVW